MDIKIYIIARSVINTKKIACIIYHESIDSIGPIRGMSLFAYTEVEKETKPCFKKQNKS